MNPILSKKQQLAFDQSTARINIWQGAVRSGKTYSSIWKLIYLIRKGIPGDIMILGYTRDSIQRNVLSELFRCIGISPPSSKATECTVFGRKIYLIGANNELAIGRIRGSTLAYAYVDEISKVPEPVFRELLARLSLKGSQLLATTNPEGPKHYIKKDFLDREDELDLRTWRFTLDDNETLPKDYIESLKKEYAGTVFFKRFILGEWAMATGLIFDGVTSDNYYIEDYPSPNFYVAAIDYGTTNPTCCLLAGISPKRWPQIHIENEYYYNSSKEGRQKTDYELAQDIKDFIGYRKLEALYIDPSAASLKLELQRLDLPVIDAVNDVVPGIRITHKFLSHRNIVMHRTRCPNLIEQLSSYAWDPKKSERGIDAPIKKDDHAVDPLRYICASLFPDGEIQSINDDISLSQRRQRAFGNENLNPAAMSTPFGLPGYF